MHNTRPMVPSVREVMRAIAPVIEAIACRRDAAKGAELTDISGTVQRQYPMLLSVTKSSHKGRKLGNAAD